MKKILLIIALPIFLFANTAFGVDVTGVWYVEVDCVRIGTDTSPNPEPYGVKDGKGYYAFEQGGYIVITEQQGDLFNGLSCPADSAIPGRTNFYGAIMGKNIYFTHWDSISVGSINNKGTVINNVVSQNQQDGPPNLPGICIGAAFFEDPLPEGFDGDNPCDLP